MRGRIRVGSVALKDLKHQSYCLKAVFSRGHLAPKRIFRQGNSWNRRRHVRYLKKTCKNSLNLEQITHVVSFDN